MVFLIPLQILIPIALVVIILIAVLWILYIKNKRLFAKLSEEKQKLASYKKSIKDLQTQSKYPKQTFKKLNNLSRKFFQEYFSLSYSLTYLELSTLFKKKNKPEIEQFCKQMSDTQYKGKEITQEQIKTLTDSFYKIVEGY